MDTSKKIRDSNEKYKLLNSDILNMEKDKNQASASTNYEIPRPSQKAKRQQIEVTKINNHFYISDATDPDAQIYYNIERANSEG